MKYFLDEEFIESGHSNPIQLISIGIVAEDGREYYAISKQFVPETAGKWVQENVLAQLESPKDFKRKTLREIATEVREFVGEDKPQFYGYYADYDWVVFCQIFGKMIDLPKGWPMYCNDLKQLAVSLGNPQLPKQGKGKHNALADARWNKVAYDFLMEHHQDGASLIADERVRQMEVEGWTPEHDDQHDCGELASAGACYALVEQEMVGADWEPSFWPWDKKWWKPSTDPIRNLVKAGALIAAEIDRLQRKAKR